MEFVHHTYDPQETIAAVATAPGSGGVAIIRISGEQAVHVADRIFSGDVASYPSHTAHFGAVVDLQGRHVDEALCLVMKQGRSYTGETTVELHCHGGQLITRRVLDTVLTAGARQALPGEFTFRAFINGNLDLAEAEAVQELIGAKNELAMESATKQLQGRLSAGVALLQARLTKSAAILEAWVDFPDEGLEFASMEELVRDLRKINDEIRILVDSYHDGRIVRSGLTLCLAGRPNVGKSSLMNALLDHDRAIVSDTPGTTRDLVEDEMRLNRLHFRLIDTAGIRTTEEFVEQEGIRRSRRAMQEADLILLVLDCTEVLDSETEALFQSAPADRTVVVWNKTDLPHPPLPVLHFPHVVALSAKEKTGLGSLHDMIDSVIWNREPPSQDEVLVTNVRHKEALSEAVCHIDKVIQGLEEGVSPEFISSDMRCALKALGKILGTDISEDILTAIFSTFCIGK